MAASARRWQASDGDDDVRRDVAHLLRRAGFGGTAAEIDALIEAARTTTSAPAITWATCGPCSYRARACKEAPAPWR